jgi:SAM-dependent methyltransferase
MDWLLRLGKRLNRTPLHPQWIANRYHRLSRMALEGARDSIVLDIGSGDSSQERLKKAPGCRVYKIDYPLTHARYNNPPDVFGDAQALPFASASVDCALLLEVIEHVAHADRAIGEVARILKPGGSLYISAPFSYPIHDAPSDYRRFTLYGMNHMLTSNGLCPVTTIQHGNPFTTSIQLFNLSILDAIDSIRQRNMLIAWLALPVAYPLCLLMNLLAAPFLLMPWKGRLCLGYFVIARRNEDDASE